MEATLKIYSVIGTDENEFSSDNLISFLDSNQSATDLRDMAAYMDLEETKIINLYEQVTGQKEAVLREYMNKETMLSAQDMLTLGFATKIIEPLRAVAYFNYKSNKMEKDEVKTFGDKLDVIGESIKALFSRLPATDQKIVDKDGKEITLAKATGAPAVGDKATPDGTFVMADGKTIVISGGAVTEVKDAVVAKSELEIANEKIADLTTKLADAEKTKADTAAIEASLKEKETKAVALVDQLTALKNTWKPEGRTRFSSVEKVGDVNLDQVREIIKNKKDK